MKHIHLFSALSLLTILGSSTPSSAQGDSAASDYVSCIKGLQAIAPPVPNDGWAEFEGEDTFGIQCYMQDVAQGSNQISFIFLSNEAGFRSVVYPVVEYVGKYSWGTETVRLPRNIIELRSNGKKYFMGNYLGVFDLITEKEFDAYIKKHTEFGHTPAKAKQVLIDRYPTELRGRAFPAFENVSADAAHECLATKINIIASSAAAAKGLKNKTPADLAASASAMVPACRTVFKN